MHRLLTRQLARQFGSPERVPPELEGLLRAVDAAYEAADADRALLERSLDLTSKEMLDRFLKLRDSEERFRQIAENMPDVFWLIEADLGTMVYVSPAYEKIWGRTCASLYREPKSWFEAIHAEDRSRVESALAGMGDAPLTLQYRIVRPDGGVRWVQDQVFPIRGRGGKSARFGGIAEDVTERRMLQDRLLQSEKLSGMGQLAAGVAHEINNPLTVILGFAQQLASEVGADDRWSLPILSIEREAQRCKNLVQDLLTFSRGARDAHGPTDLNGAVGSALALIRPKAKMVRAAVRSALEPRLPLVGVHPHQLQQLVINLANNALDCLPVGGTLSVRTRRQQEGRRRWAVLEVTDDGPGIPPDVLPRIFEPFFTTKPAGRGTGLGLALVHEIVEKHGGSIDVASRPGSTLFSIRLPAARSTGARTGRPAKPAEKRGRA